jgi:hypothetical protein
MLKKLRLVKDVPINTLEAYQVAIPAGTILEVEIIEENEIIEHDCGDPSCPCS